MTLKSINFVTGIDGYVSIEDDGTVAFEYTDNIPGGCSSILVYTSAQLRALANAADKLQEARR